MKTRAERNHLSPREEEVLRLAGNGLTDQQIANALHIRVSTVTTYWVRVRSKVGQLSRAELISLSLRQRSQETMDQLKAEIARLNEELAQKKASELEALKSSEIMRAALEALPAGMLILRPDGRIATTNKAGQALLDKEGPTLKAKLKAEMTESQKDKWMAVVLLPVDSGQ